MPQHSGSIAASPNMLAITPSDTADLPKIVRFIRCMPVSGVAGTLKIKTLDGDIVSTEIAKGERLEIVAVKVFATGTSATGLEGHV